MSGMLAKVLKISLDAAKDQYLFYYSWSLCLGSESLWSAFLARVLVHMDDAWQDG